MDFLLSFVLGVITTWVTEVAKKWNMPPRLVIAGIASILAMVYLGASFTFTKETVDAIASKGMALFTTWYTTSTIGYEWIYKLLIEKKEGK
jgi:hypothetical protein